MKDKIKKVFFDNGIDISDSQSEMLYSYYNFLVQENRNTNLTSITDFEDVLIKHFLDSAYSVKFFPDIFSSSLIDVGTGAGFPGLVLSIVCPDSNITLLETSGKRVSFLNHAIELLTIKNVNVIKGRAEDFGKDSHLRESFDYSTSRAVAPLNILLEYLFPFIKVGGHCIAYKGSDISDEIDNSIKALTVLGGDNYSIEKFFLPNDFGGRTFFISKKINPTPLNYPRRAGIPSKRPII